MEYCLPLTVPSGQIAELAGLKVEPLTKSSITANYW